MALTQLCSQFIGILYVHFNPARMSSLWGSHLIKDIDGRRLKQKHGQDETEGQQRSLTAA